MLIGKLLAIADAISTQREQAAEAVHGRGQAGGTLLAPGPQGRAMSRKTAPLARGRGGSARLLGGSPRGREGDESAELGSGLPRHTHKPASMAHAPCGLT